MVATPIGNLEDITFRAVKILSEVDLIAAEDTRHTKILLDRYQIKKALTSYHKFNIKAKTQYLISLLKEGKNLALVSDAGMPGVSDPGYEVISGAVEQKLKVEVIPGPSAAITALVASGLPTDRFIFEGFLPKKLGKRKKRLEELKADSRTIIMYESPFRLVKTLHAIKEIMGDWQVVVCRELTKKFEEIIRGKAGDLIDKIGSQRVRGEVVVLLSGQVAQRERVS